MDGSAVRLHPSQNSDAHPVIGSLDRWRIHSPLPPAIPGVIHADDAAAGSTRRHLVYEAYSQADLVSRKGAQAIETMYWGRADPIDFYARWRNEIRSRDSLALARYVAGHDNPAEDVYRYLAMRVWELVYEIRRIGEAGWSFREHSAVVPCLVWADGGRGSQMTPYRGAQPYEQWWPCIVVPIPEATKGQLLPFYCPALAWARARPWLVHHSRVRLFDIRSI